MLVWLLLAGCAQNPYQMRKEFQHKQAAKLQPAELAGEGGAWRALRTLRVRLYSDDRRDSVHADFGERLSRANQVLESALRLRLVLEDFRELPPQPGASNGDTDALLVAIERLDPGRDVDFVVAIVSAAPVVTLSFHELGRARVLGKHVVLRTMDDVGELRALEGFDTLEPTERSRLYQQRKRHKETAVLLHELGHCLGALHTREPAELMHPGYTSDMHGFASENRELMGYVVDERLAGRDPQQSAPLRAQLATYLKQSAFAGWVPEERQSFLAELEQAGTPAAESPQAAAAAVQPAPAPAAGGEDLSALSDADRTRYLGLDAAVKTESAKAVYAALVELTRAYPNSLPVQQKACQTGMQLGLTHRDIQPFCDRMMQLSMQAPAPVR